MLEPQEFRARHRLRPEQLRWTCDPATLPFETTAEIRANEVILGQDRAVRALDLGLTVAQPGYNIYIAGPVGTGRTTYARQKIQSAAAARSAPPDWCYLYDFPQPDQPIAIPLPPGQGVQFRRDVEQLLDELKDGIRKLFASEQFDTRRSEVLQTFETRINEIWQGLENQARQLGYQLQRTPTGIVTVPVGPSGEPITQEMFAMLPEQQREEVQKRG